MTVSGVSGGQVLICFACMGNNKFGAKIKYGILFIVFIDAVMKCLCFV